MALFLFGWLVVFFLLGSRDAFAVDAVPRTCEHIQTQACMYRQARSREYTMLPILLHDGALSGFDLSYSKTSSLKKRRKKKKKCYGRNSSACCQVELTGFFCLFIYLFHNERESKVWNSSIWSLITQRASPPVALSYAIAALCCSICMIIVIMIKHRAIIWKREGSK